LALALLDQGFEEATPIEIYVFWGNFSLWEFPGFGYADHCHLDFGFWIFPTDESAGLKLRKKFVFSQL